MSSRLSSLPALLVLLLLSLLLSLVACNSSGNLPGDDDDDVITPPDDDDDDDDDDDATDDDDSVAGPETLSTCAMTGTGSSPASSHVIVTNKTNGLVVDIYEITVAAGDCIWVKGDNGAEGGDLYALVTDSADAIYGLASDYSQLDDDWTCTTANADGYGCPEASVTASTDGVFSIAIGVWADAAGAVTGSDYSLSVAVNGTDVDPGAPTQDDVSIE